MNSFSFCSSIAMVRPPVADEHRRAAMAPALESPWESDTPQKGGFLGSAALSIHVLGELEVALAGRSVALPASRKTRALLGYLVVTGRPVLRERL